MAKPIKVGTNINVAIAALTPTPNLFLGVAEYADNAAAIAAGLTAGMIYRTLDVLKIVH